MCFVLLAVLTLFLAAFSIEVHGRAENDAISASSSPTYMVVEADEQSSNCACYLHESI
jgi:hypothetical protein